MNDKNIKLFRYLAGFLFALTFVRTLVSLEFYFSFQSIAMYIIPLLMAISMFADIPPLFAAGAGIQVLSSLLSFIRYLDTVGRGNTAGNVWRYLLTAVAYGFVLLLVFKRKPAVNISLIATLFIVVSGVMSYAYYIGSFSEKLNRILMSIQNSVCITAIPLILAAVVIQHTPEKTSVKKISISTPAATGNPTERLMKLKELLDLGAITQEEFDEKKKQLLGL